MWVLSYMIHDDRDLISVNLDAVQPGNDGQAAGATHSCATRETPCTMKRFFDDLSALLFLFM